MRPIEPQAVLDAYQRTEAERDPELRLLSVQMLATTAVPMRGPAKSPRTPASRLESAIVRVTKPWSAAKTDRKSVV